MNFFIVEINNKQYYSKINDVLTIDYLESNIGDKIKIKVLGKIEDQKITLNSTQLEIEILEHKKGKKIYSFKKNRRKRYIRKKGHRDLLTVVKVLEG